MALAKDTDCWKKTGDASIRACTKIIKSKRLFGKRISKKNLAIAYNNRGWAYKNRGDREKAIADYRKALEIDPSHELAKSSLKALGVEP